MTREKALEWFKEELKDGKCSDECPQCNAYDVAIRSLEAWDNVYKELKAMFIEYGSVPTEDELAYNRAVHDIGMVLYKHLKEVEL